MRYGALGLGFLYAQYRTSFLTNLVHKEEHAKEEALNSQLLAEARIAYEAHLNRIEAEAASTEGIVTDSESYRYNAEKYMNWSTKYHKLEEPAKKK